MRKKLHFGNPWFEPGFKTPWVSFEDDPTFRKWDEKFILACNRCLSRLHEDLKNNRGMVNLVEAYDCWRVVVEVESHEHCKKLLKLLVKNKPNFAVYGQFGAIPYGGDKPKIIFFTEKAKDRDLILKRIQTLTKEMNTNAEVSIERACQNFHRDILGDPLKWEKQMEIKLKENLDLVLKRLENVVNSPARDHLEDHLRFRHE